MELKKCMGCMEPFEGYPCPNCGFDAQNEKKMEYALPLETILAGKYLVGKVLGQGGFGITYIGWDLALEHKVAIKEYYPSGQVSRAPGNLELSWYTTESSCQAREGGMQMFLKEARKMSKVDEIPGIVRVRDLFQENSTAYIVMDYVEGETLKARLQRAGPMSWEQAKKAFLPAMEAMGKVHKAGLVHRDISPDNLMLTPDGGVRVLDLGAAKDLNLNSGFSSMQVAKNGFSPLEQYVQRGNSGPWTDVYAMGATLYYTLTGKLPPSAVDRLNQDTISWSEPGLAALGTAGLAVLQRAMAVQVKERLQTMEELANGLSGAQAAEPQPVKRRPQMAASDRWKNRKTLTIAVAALLVVCLAVGTTTIVSKRQQDAEPSTAETTASVSKPTETRPIPTIATEPHGTMRSDIPEIQRKEDWSGYVQQPVFGSDVMRNEISSVTFLSDKKQLTGDTWDISEQGNNSVLACLKKNGEMYDLYIAANGGVVAPQDCSGLFALYENLETIQFNDSFDTSAVQSMSGMFLNCGSLKELNLIGLDTSNVENMSYMFSECRELEELDVSSFDTSCVTDMSYMFSSCWRLKNIDMSSFRTKKVASYKCMFNFCADLQALDLRSFTFADGADVDGMLSACIDLYSLQANGLVIHDVSGYRDSNAVKLGNMTGYPYIISPTLISCRQMTVTLDVEMKYGSRCEEWNLWGKVDGTFVEIGKITLPGGNGSVTKTVYFNSPLRISAIMVEPAVIGGYSWSMKISVSDAHIGVEN